MKLMITGATGLLGRACREALADYEPVCCAWSRASENDLKLDLTDADAVKAAIAEVQPDVIIHTAAERKPDICENQQDLTQSLNVEATQTLAESGFKMLYISTDYVFDGTNPPYSVDAQPNPLNFYGETKLAGERVVLEASKNHIVLRVPILYGEVEALDESPVTLMVNKLLNPEPVQEDHWAVRFPTYVRDIAATLKNWIPTIENASGIYHFSGSEALTKYEMVCAMGEALGLDHSHISPNPKPPPGAPRPQNSQLDIQRLEHEVSLVQTPFRENIGSILEPFLKG